MKPYGYLVPDGYFGRLKDGSWRLFPTENEYLDYVRED